MGVNLVDDALDIRVPDTDVVVEPCTKQQHRDFAKGQRQNPSGVFFIRILLGRSDSVPKGEFPVHRSRSQHLELRNTHHTRYYVL